MELFQKFERLGDPADLERAITCLQRAVDLTPESHGSRPNHLGNLGMTLLVRFQQGDSIADLEDGISLTQKAIDLTPDGHPSKLLYLGNLGAALEIRFKRQGLLADLDEAIAQKRKVVGLTPDSSPDKPTYLNDLGEALESRFDRHGSLKDLEDAILLQQKAVDLTPDDHPDKPTYLSSLGGVLEMRFDRRGSPADLEGAITQKQKAVNITPEGHPDKPGRFTNLGNALQRRFARYGSLADLEETIVQGQNAVDLTPDGHPDKPLYLNNLGRALEARFDRHGSLEDLENAIVLQQMTVKLTPNDDPGKPMYLSNLGTALETRFDRHGSLADLEDAITSKQKAVDLTPDDHPNKAMFLSSLGNALETRFDRQGSLVDLEEAIVHKRKSVSLTPDGHSAKPGRLNNLGNALKTRFDRRGSPADMEEALVQSRMAVDLTPDGHTAKPGRLNNLGNISERKYRQSGALPDLNNSILHWQKAANLMPRGHPHSAICLKSVSRGLRARFERLGDQKDLQNALSAAREAAESSAASSKLRLRCAVSWAQCCKLGSTSSLPAYECAIKVLPRLAWLGLAVADQYYLLAEAGSVARDAVAEAIAEHDFATAIEWAEQGRSIVWQNLLSLRTPLDELQGSYPELATRLQALSRHLERGSEAQSMSKESMSPEVANNQMTLAMERDRLIDEIRKRPGFNGFMKPKSFKELALAAREGPVIFMNLGQHRCDALVLLARNHSTPHVMPIPLERVTLQKAESLSKSLVGLLSSAGVRERASRKYKGRGGSKDKNAIFKEILKTLWLDYVQPVIDGLEYQVNVESPPRIWWCTTGPLAFLPLHAAGLYDIKEAGYKVSDYVVSSYTPTLTALLDEMSPISSDVKILGVAVSNTPGAPLPCTEDEVRNLQRLVPNLPIASLVNEKATQERVLKELERSNWAHLACHGEQVGGKPMESGLILHDGKLELSKIVKARLPNADFVFLSACQTAVGDGGVPEESAHLAAGMLFAGYRGVVATMWSIQDDIAPRVADDFYRYLFRHGQPKRAEAAYALHRAIRSLQEAEIPFTSWVPFIHIGR